MTKPLLILTLVMTFVLTALAQEETRTRTERLPFYTPLPKQPLSGEVHEVPPPEGPTSGFTSSSVASGGNATSPETGMANTLGNIPVNYYTGSANINLPIYTLSEGNISLPLYLMFNSTGIRAGELASSVGLGWMLEGIPRLTRVIRGVADEGFYYGGTNLKGYYEHGYELAANPSTYGSEHDGESDWYYFSVNGTTYKFVFDAFKKAHFFPETDIKVNVETAYTGFGFAYTFSRFDVITPDGTTYRFSAPENTYSQNLWETNLEMDAEAANNASPISPSTQFTKSAWQIDKIISPYGQELVFKYSLSQYSYYKLAEQSTEDCNAPQNKINRVFVRTSTISEIEGLTTVIRFDKGDGIRQDLESFSASIPQNQTTNAPKVSSVKVYHKNASGTLSSSFQEWKFTYDYFSGTLNGGAFDQPAGYTTGNSGGVRVGTTHRRRMILTALENPDGTRYDFDYQGKDYNFKTRFTYGVDDWGYMNGQDGNINNFGLIGRDDEFTSCGSIRTSDLTFMRYGSLNKISTNQGLEVSFEYEANRAANFAGGSQDIGGLRIKKITTADTKRGLTTRKEYEYLDGTSSSGFLILKPVYTYTVAQFANDKRASYLYGSLLSETGGASVGYSKVKETVYNNSNAATTGYTVFTFDHTKQETPFGEYIPFYMCSTPSGKCYYPQLYNPGHNYRNGLPLKTEIFNQAGLSISSSTNTYTSGTGIQQEHISRSRKVFFEYNFRYTSLYDLKYYKYRIESVQSLTRAMSGTGPAIESAEEYFYKDEMPVAYRNKYPGKHNMVSKVVTTDEEGITKETERKYVADFEFDTSTAYCLEYCEINGTCNVPSCWYATIVTTPPPSGSDARGLFEAKDRNMIAAEVEGIEKIYSSVIAASYQTFHTNTSASKGLPRAAYGLRKSPKPGYQEVTYSGTEMTKDSDFGNPLLINETYNSLGYLTSAKSPFGAGKKMTYTSSVIPFETKVNEGKEDELYTASVYSKTATGVLTQTAPNNLTTSREFDTIDRPLRDKDRHGNIVAKYQYKPVPGGVPVSSISWNSGAATKTCSGTNVTLTVSVNGLVAAATAWFSTDGGATWQNANIGTSGFTFTRPAATGTQEIRARASDNTGAVITTAMDIACDAPVAFGWGPYSVATLEAGPPRVCQYNVSVVGLTSGGTAQFSTDNGVSWINANMSATQMQYALFAAPSIQEFWARDSNNPANVIYGILNVCN